MWKCADILRRFVASQRDAGSLTLSSVCPHCGLFPIEFLWLVSNAHKSRQRRQCDWWCAACGGQYDQGTDGASQQ